MNSNFIIIIPARLNSTRLPGKILADIGGKPMIIRVAQRAQCSRARAVYIAADEKKVCEIAQAFQIPAILTSPEHQSGTERLGEAIDYLKIEDHAIIVNVQGDEPFIDPLVIDQVAARLQEDPALMVATACYPIRDLPSLLNPNVVKAVLSKSQRVLYFSRAAIPYTRKEYKRLSSDKLSGPLAYRHIGIYAYRAAFLRKYAMLPPSPLEQFESLEQLRVLWHDFHIGAIITNSAPIAGIDTLDDLNQAQRFWLQAAHKE